MFIAFPTKSCLVLPKTLHLPQKYSTLSQRKINATIKRYKDTLFNQI